MGGKEAKISNSNSCKTLIGVDELHSTHNEDNATVCSIRMYMHVHRVQPGQIDTRSNTLLLNNQTWDLFMLTPN